MDFNAGRVEKLLIRVVNWVGDAVMTTPAIGAVRESFPQAEITLLANPPSATTGHPVQLLLRLVGGPRGTDLAPPGMEIFAGQGQSQLRLGGSEGTSRTVKSGEELDLTVEWSAGAIAGPPAPGTYSLIGRIFLKNSTVVEVPLTFTVSG